MECNKDEAERAKEIAERKFAERNYAGAKKFALKAQNLYPGLDDLSQMMSILDVYISAENKINGESDWYGVLGTKPSDDDETIRKQYRKLALMLHPDKNKAIGAEGAFKLVSEAWSLLSDKPKRLAYNQKRNLKVFQQKVSTQSRGSPAASNGCQDFKKSFTSNTGKQQPNNVQATFTAAPSSKKTDTFWTICNRCKTHYEYLRMYLNHTLLCPNCHEAFMAAEKDPPPNVFKQSTWSSQQTNTVSGSTHARKDDAFNSGKTGASTGAANYQWGPFSQTGDRVAGVASSAAVQAASVVQQASEKVQRQREERQLAAEWERNRLFKESGMDRPAKKRTLEENHLNGYSGYSYNGNGKGSFEAHRIFGMSNAYVKPNRTRELSYAELRAMLTHKAKTKILTMLQEWRLSRESGTSNKDSANKKQKKGEKENPSQSKFSVIDKKPDAGYSDDDDDSSNEDPKISTVAITVPDPDFHNFDLDRAENAFKEEQVWASYDGDDGMPRFYARIHKVISLNPFRMRISWLNSKSNSEFGSIDWVGRGFTKTCGEFRVGKHESCGSLNSFSHKVSWFKGNRGGIRIYPNKGEVWALYKNWSPEWHREEIPDEEMHKYEMVQVLTYFDEEQGASVAPLIKVPGFKAVFRTCLDDLRRIPKGEMFRFSHQVPYYLLTGEEADNAPKGCLELDPAATPLELIQMSSEASDAPNTEAPEPLETASMTEQQ